MGVSTRHARASRATLLFTAVFVVACSGKYVVPGPSPGRVHASQGGAELDAATHTETGAPIGSSGGSGGTGATDTGIPAPGLGAGAAGNVTPQGPPPPYAYFYANPVDGGRIFGVPPGAGDQAVLATGSIVDIGQVLVFDSDHVYYTVADASTSVVRTSVLALPVTGKGPAEVVARGFLQVSGLAVDEDSLYVLDVDVPVTAGAAYTTTLSKVPIGRIASADAGVERLAETRGVQAGAVTTYGGYVYWTEPPVLDFFNPVFGFVKRVPKAGGTVETLATSTRPAGIAVNQDGVYWLDTGHPGVDCTPTDGAFEYLATGSDSPVVLASNLEGARSLTSLGGAVYFSTIGAFCNGGGGPVGSIFRISSPHGPVETLATKLPSPSDLYGDSDGVYFTEVIETSSWVMKPAMIAR